MAWPLRLIAPILAMWCAAATAAETYSPEMLRGSATQAPDLVFPAEPSPLSWMSTPRMALYKPDGPGPFPALVLYHQCGGLGQSGKKPNASMLDWARQAVAKGYVTLMVDALEPRSVDTVCFGPKNGVTIARGVKDAFQAAEYLRRFDFVDKNKVALAGYSWGAMIGLLATSRNWSDALGDGQRFNAVVSMYPGCFTIRPRQGQPFDMVQDDLDRPLLVLTGGQDTETPARDCRDRLEPARAAGAPVELHHYPDATHCWDCAQLDGFSKTDVRGNAVSYRYDAAITRDSAERMFDFLGRVLK